MDPNSTNPTAPGAGGASTDTGVTQTAPDMTQVAGTVPQASPVSQDTTVPVASEPVATTAPEPVASAEAPVTDENTGGPTVPPTPTPTV